MSYVQGDLSRPELYDNLRAALAEADKTHGTEGNVIFYLAVAEQFFCPAIERLHEAGLTDSRRAGRKASLLAQGGVREALRP